MLIRISLIIAILAGIAAIVLGNMQLRSNIQGIIEERESEKAAKQKAQNELAKTKNELKKTEQSLEKEKKEHTDTKAKLSTAEKNVTQLTKEKADLSQSLATTQGNLKDAQQKLSAWTALGIPVNQVQALIRENGEMKLALEAYKQEKAVLAYNNRKLRAALDRYEGPGDEAGPEMPTGLKGKITAVDPKWDFVVLDVGEKDGVLPDGVFLVNRNGRLVGKVKVSSVQPKRSIANVMPGWKLAELMEGDEVIY